MRRKHLQQKEVLESLEADQHIVKALGSRGDNLIEVEFSSGRQELVLLPARFNKTIWIKKGSFLVVQQAKDQAQSSNRICGTIDAVLDVQDKASLKKGGHWPAEFEEKPANGVALVHSKAGKTDDEGSSNDDLSPLKPNTNRPIIEYHLHSSDDDE